MKSQSYPEPKPRKNNIVCPECGEELWDADPRMIFATYPPKVKVSCRKCGYTNYRVL